MAAFAEYSVARIRALQDTLRRRVQTAAALQDAAQEFANLLAEEFEPVLARVFATIEFQALPEFDRRFVTGRAREANLEAQLKPTTRVLSLLGTRGAQPEWNERARSKRYLGIPLVSEHFVQSLPMVAALLTELGMAPESFRPDGPGVPIDQLLGGEAAGIFHVPEPRVSTDPKGRRIIPAQDFIHAQEVATVFGIGGIWPNGELVVCIVFTREVVARATVRRLAPALSVFRSATTALAMNGKYFA